MHPFSTKLKIRVKGDISETHRVDLNHTDENNFIDLSSDDSASNDENTPTFNDSQKQLVLYDPHLNNTGNEIEVMIPDPISSSYPKIHNHNHHHHQRVLPSVGAYTVQCANCFKWRLIPTQEIYERIREHITEMPFVCEMACEWKADVSCGDPPDIEQDGSRLWAIDKPDIAQTPPGWQRDLRIRGEGGTRFADIYYTAPTGSKLRSIPDVEKYLFKHPEYLAQGVRLSQFSFKIPKPLQEDYVRKRPANVAPLQQPEPLAVLGPEEHIDLQLGLPGFSGRCTFNPVGPPVKKARSSPGKPRVNFDLVLRQPQI